MKNMEINEQEYTNECIVRLCHVLNRYDLIDYDDLAYITNKITLEEYQERTGYGKDSN